MDKVDGGLVGVRNAFRLAASMCFMLASLIWLLLECKYKGWPWRMMQLDSPKEDVRKACVNEIYGAGCTRCLDAGCTGKAKALGRDAPGLLKHKGVRSTMRIWKRKARFCNMNTERLLSKITKSTQRHGHAERLCANGFLAQVNARHMAAGGKDVNKITRKKLKQTGVPLRCSKRVHGKRRIRTSKPNRFSRFIAKKQRARDSKMPMVEYKGWFQKQVVDYWSCGAQISSDEESLEADHGEAKYRAAIGNDLWASSSAETPVLPQVLRDELQKLFGSDEKRTLGLTERLAPLRNKLIDHLFVKDAGDIPSSLKLPTPPLICGQAHPGVCRREITFRIQTAVDALKSSLKQHQWIPGFGFRLEAVNNRTDGPATYGQHWFLACVTPYVILAEMKADDSEPDVGITFSCAEKIMVKMFKDGDPLSLTLIWRDDVPPKTLHEATDLFHPNDGELRRQQIWDEATHNKPATSGPAEKKEPVQVSELDALLKQMKESLRGLPDGDFDKDEDEEAIDELAFSKSILAKFKRQAGKRRRATKGGRLTRNMKAKKKAETELQQQQNPKEKPKEKRAANFTAPKNGRRVAIDGREFFELHPGGRFTGYCLVCKHEHMDSVGNSIGQQCCKSVTFAGKRAMEPHEARRRLLAWEAAGSTLAGATARTDHMAMGGQLLSWYAA